MPTAYATGMASRVYGRAGFGPAGRTLREIDGTPFLFSGAAADVRIKPASFYRRIPKE
jgi:hypothetical protein